MHLVKKKLFLFVLFLSGSKWKKNVSLLLQINNNFFLYLFVLFWFRPKWKKQVSLLLGFKQKKSNSNFLFLFVLCFAFPNDKNWWQVGRRYGIPNLVMGLWLRWVAVTKYCRNADDVILKWSLRTMCIFEFSAMNADQSQIVGGGLVKEKLLGHKILSVLKLEGKNGAKVWSFLRRFLARIRILYGLKLKKLRIFKIFSKNFIKIINKGSFCNFIPMYNIMLRQTRRKRHLINLPPPKKKWPFFWGGGKIFGIFSWIFGFGTQKNFW